MPCGHARCGWANNQPTDDRPTNRREGKIQIQSGSMARKNKPVGLRTTRYTYVYTVFHCYRSPPSPPPTSHKIVLVVFDRWCLRNTIGGSKENECYYSSTYRLTLSLSLSSLFLQSTLATPKGKGQQRINCNSIQDSGCLSVCRSVCLLYRFW